MTRYILIITFLTSSFIPQALGKKKESHSKAQNQTKDFEQNKKASSSLKQSNNKQNNNLNTYLKNNTNLQASLEESKNHKNKIKNTNISLKENNKQKIKNTNISLKENNKQKIKNLNISLKDNNNQINKIDTVNESIDKAPQSKILETINIQEFILDLDKPLSLTVFSSAKRLLNGIKSYFKIESEDFKTKTQGFKKTNQNSKKKNQKFKLSSYLQSSFQKLKKNLKEKNKLENSQEKNKSESSEKENTTNKTNLSLELESAFSIKKNNLIEKDQSWTYSMSYIDITSQYKFSKNLFLEISFDLFYKETSWETSIEDVFIKYKSSKFLPTDFIVGYFEYPVLNFKSSDHNFFKKTLLEKNLFPNKTEDIGALLKINIWKPFYLSLSSQKHTGVKEILSPLNTAKNTYIASLIYEKESQHINASYLKQNFFSQRKKQAFGLGSDFSYSFYSFLFNFKGELWNIKQWRQNTLSYYIFPSIQWKRLNLSYLFGKAHYELAEQKSESLEYTLRTDFYLTDELFLSLEKVQESDNITKNSSWILSLKSHLNF